MSNENENLEFFSQNNNYEDDKEKDIYIFRKFFPNLSINETSYNLEISEDENSERYFKKDNSNLSYKIDQKKGPNVLFNVTKEKTNEIKEYIGKKRGRKLNQEKIEMEKTKEKFETTHNKNDKFNILTKVLSHSLNTLIQIVNCFLDEFNYNKNERFLYIESCYKKNVKKDNIEEMKNKKLSEIISLNISKKFHNQDINKNKNLYEKIKNDSRYTVVNKFLNETFLFFFQNVYYKSDRTINLQKYGVDAFLTLSVKVELHNDKISTFENDKDYIKLYNKCINDCFFDGKLLFQLEK